MVAAALGARLERVVLPLKDFASIVWVSFANRAPGVLCRALASWRAACS